MTLTVNMSNTVTVAGGNPTLTLNDGGTASYTGGSGTSALTFSYTVAAGQEHARPERNSIQSRQRHHQGCERPAGTLQIDTTAPTVSQAIASPPAIAPHRGPAGIGPSSPIRARNARCVGAELGR